MLTCGIANWLMKCAMSDIFGRGTFGQIDERSLMSFRIYPYFNDEKLGVATAFLYEDLGTPCLVTNWHNLTGRHPETHRIGNRHAALPNKIDAHIPIIDPVGDGEIRTGTFELMIRIYHDEEMLKPAWLEHPEFRERVDVAVIPLKGIDPEVSKHFVYTAAHQDLWKRDLSPDAPAPYHAWLKQ